MVGNRRFRAEPLKGSTTATGAPETSPGRRGPAGHAADGLPDGKGTRKPVVAATRPKSGRRRRHDTTVHACSGTRGYRSANTYTTLLFAEVLVQRLYVWFLLACLGLGLLFLFMTLVRYTTDLFEVPRDL